MLQRALRRSANTDTLIGLGTLAAFGYSAAALLNPMGAGAAMALSGISVVLNALRLRRFERRH